MSNGGPSWLGPRLLALEVIRSDQHAGIATVDPTTGEVVVTDARGFAPSATRDGARIAVLDATTDVVAVMDPTDWLAGVAGDDPGIAPPKESSVQDVAISADGTRLAIVYGASSGAASSVVMLRLSGAAWESETSIQVPGDGAVSIDWLD